MPSAVITHGVESGLIGIALRWIVAGFRGSLATDITLRACLDDHEDFILYAGARRGTDEHPILRSKPSGCESPSHPELCLSACTWSAGVFGQKARKGAHVRLDPMRSVGYPALRPVARDQCDQP